MRADPEQKRTVGEARNLPTVGDRRAIPNPDRRLRETNLRDMDTVTQTPLSQVDDLEIGRMVIEWQTGRLKPGAQRSRTRRAARVFRQLCGRGRSPFLALHVAHCATCIDDRKFGRCRHSRLQRLKLLQPAQQFLHEERGSGI
jgi:hypothetical protein